jgi:hypothetical protein
MGVHVEDLNEIVDKLMEEIVRPTTKPRKQKVEVQTTTPEEDKDGGAVLPRP